MTASVGDSIMVGINGPPLSSWNATKYVVSSTQLVEVGRHGALDKSTGVSKKHNERNMVLNCLINASDISSITYSNFVFSFGNNLY